VGRPLSSVGRGAGTDKVQSRPGRAVLVLAVSRDFEFLEKLKTAALDRGWDLAEASDLSEGLNVASFEHFPVAVLDQMACEGSWENGLSALVACGKPPCVILASDYGDEYLRREVVRLGGYDVLSKSAPPAAISQVVEFAWFWSRHSATSTKPRPSGRAAPPTATRGPKH